MRFFNRQHPEQDGIGEDEQRRQYSRIGARRGSQAPDAPQNRGPAVKNDVFQATARLKILETFSV
jgi:hypothetical protein